MPRHTSRPTVRAQYARTLREQDRARRRARLASKRTHSTRPNSTQEGTR